MIPASAGIFIIQKSDEMAIGLGSQGPEVEAWQHFLNSFVEAGVLAESCRLIVDGKFGKTTHIATLAYQIREAIVLSPNIPPSAGQAGGDGAGVVGPLTQNHPASGGTSFILWLKQEEGAARGPIAPKAR
jgi:hypothetical protein